MSSGIKTIPSDNALVEAFTSTPEHMWPTSTPIAAYAEGILTDEQCDAIIERYEQEPSYSFPHCNAQTRECPRPLESVLRPVVDVGKGLNDIYWQFDLREVGAWMQTYGPGMDYGLHMDGSPGQSRKLTAVLMLSQPGHYVGGGLWVRYEPKEFMIPRTRGTVVVFPSWLLHYVAPVKSGKRQTINLGFWGPPFK